MKKGRGNTSLKIAEKRLNDDDGNSSLRIAYTNFNCLTNKTCYLNEYCSENNIDLFGCTETWLNQEDHDASLRMSEYSFFRSDSPTGRRIHGVGLFVKKDISVLREACDIPNVLVIRLLALDVLIVLVYRPPHIDMQLLIQLNELLDRIYDSTREICVIGDFNLPGIAWNNVNATRNATSHEKEFYNMFNDMGLTQIVRFPTFLSGNILDLILLTEEDRYAGLEYSQPFPKCGHVVIKFEYIYNSVEREAASRWDWSRGDYPAISEAYYEEDWDYEFSHLSFEQKCTRFCEFYTDTIRTHIPHVSNRRQRQPPWLRRVPRRFIIERNETWKKLLECRRKHGRHGQGYRSALNEYRACCRSYDVACKSERSKYEYSLLIRSKYAPKAFHSYIGRGRKSLPTTGPIKNDSGSLVVENHGMSEIFADSYFSVYTNAVPDNPSPHQTCPQTTNEITFSATELRSRLKRLKIDKAMGPDMIHPRVLRSCADAISIPLVKIMTQSFEMARLPNVWKTAAVIPIHKGGDRNSALKYRPVSLTCLPCKVSEEFVVDALTEHLEENEILSNVQFGFRPGRSVTDQLLLAYDMVTRGYDQGDMVNVILLDFAKAFDKVSHDILLEKLFQLGIRGALLGWIRSFLSDRKFYVSVHGSHSSLRDVTSGVPQGSLLGPVLFLVFINHLCHDLNSAAFLFADDLKLISRTGKTRCDGITLLQQDLNIVNARAKSWGLPFNTEKCVSLRFCRKTSANLDATPPQYRIGGVTIKNEDSGRDLGVVVDNELKFHEHTTQANAKSRGALHNLLRSTINRSPEFIKELIMTYTRPVLEFGSVIWNAGFVGDTTRLESLQRQATRRVTGLGDLPYDERLQCLNLFSVKGRLLRADMIQCWKIFHDKAPFQPEDIFRLEIRQSRGHPYRIFKERFVTEARKRFFTCRVVNDWNGLPASVVTTPSIDKFKSSLAGHLGNRLFEYYETL